MVIDPARNVVPQRHWSQHTVLVEVCWLSFWVCLHRLGIALACHRTGVSPFFLANYIYDERRAPDLPGGRHQQRLLAAVPGVFVSMMTLPNPLGGVLVLLAYRYDTSPSPLRLTAVHLPPHPPRRQGKTAWRVPPQATSYTCDAPAKTPKADDATRHQHDLISQDRADGQGGFEMSFYSYDGLGSVRGLTDAIGTSLGHYHYDAYGTKIEDTVPVANPYLFAGERFDNDLGLYYLRARYLDVETGRFWTLDEFEGTRMDALSLHKYLYVQANPVSNVDPSGYAGLSAHLATGLNIAARFGGRIFTLANFGLRVAGIIDTTYMMYDIIRALQSGAVQKYLSSFEDLASRKVAEAGNYNLKKLLAMELEHYVGIFSNVGRRLASIIRLINKHHSTAIHRAARKPSRARFVIFLPSLPAAPGEGFKPKDDGRLPLQMPIRVWKFKVKLVAGTVGGRLLGFGISGGGRTTQFMRIDYHGRRKGNHPAPYTQYFQAGSPVLGESFRPWFHYHVEK